MIFIKNPLVFCSASSHERRVLCLMNGGKRETNTMDGTQEAAAGEKSIHRVNYTNRTRKCFMSYRLVCIFIMRDTEEWGGCASRVNETITDLDWRWGEAEEGGGQDTFNTFRTTPLTFIIRQCVITTNR